ncbi:hypothetical protein ACFX2A_000306 [Malus domestica]
MSRSKLCIRQSVRRRRDLMFIDPFIIVHLRRHDFMFIDPFTIVRLIAVVHPRRRDFVFVPFIVIGPRLSQLEARGLSPNSKFEHKSNTLENPKSKLPKPQPRQESLCARPSGCRFPFQAISEYLSAFVSFDFQFTL